MTDYKQRGDDFRDEVAALLRLAGFEAETEVRADHTKVDVVSLLQRDPFRGDSHVFLEAKHTNGNLGADTAAEFVGKYASLVARRACDEAWLVSRHPLTPDAKAVVAGTAGLRAMDLATLQARLMDFGGYLRALRDAFDASGIGAYYVPPRDREGKPLEERVRAWLAAPASAAPMAVIGRYGIGKSTFARHFTARLAAEAQANPSARIPVLIPLGDVFDDQSLEGLLGKALAGRTRVGNYNFPLFERLNAAGRFVLVFDGFDEMKHGLTPSRFERNMRELLRLDGGEAKLLFLGRDTAFHSAEEFDQVVLGRQRTAGGALVAARDRRALEPVHVEDFRPEDVRSFVSRYLPLRAGLEARGAPGDVGWTAARVAEVLSGRFDGLLARPVHAQMLCDIASRREAVLAGLTKHGLYDQFVHYLVDREVAKRDGALDLGVEVRRRFNAMLAWWLWCRDQRAETTLGEVPQRLVDSAAGRAAREVRGEELRRALVIGCLVEKGGDHFYFSHRSVQEFLVAEHLASTDLLAAEADADAGEPLRLLALVTPEVQEFLTERLAMADGPAIAERWLKALPRLQGLAMEPQTLGLFVRAHQVAPPGGVSAWAGEPWAVLLGYFAANGACEFAPKSQKALDALAEARSLLRSPRKIGAQAAALLLGARHLRSAGTARPADVASFVAAWLPEDALRGSGRPRVDAAYARPAARIQIRKADDFRLWAFLRAATSERLKDGTLVIGVDLRRLEADMSAQLGFGFARAESAVGVQRVPAALVLRAMGVLGSREFELEPVRRFLNVPGGFDARFQAVEVEGNWAAPSADGGGWSPPSYRSSERVGRRPRPRPG